MSLDSNFWGAKEELTTEFHFEHPISHLHGGSVYHEFKVDDFKRPVYSLTSGPYTKNTPDGLSHKKMKNKNSSKKSKNSSKAESTDTLDKIGNDRTIFEKDIASRNKEGLASQPYSSDQTGKYSKMQDLERILVETDKFHVIYNQLYFYNGVYHQAVYNERELLRLMRTLLSSNILDQIPSIGRIRDVFCYLLANPDITFDISPDFEKEFKDFIVFDNAIFDAATGKTRKHNVKWPVISQVQCDFTPDDMSCPNFERFLDDISDGDPDVSDLICEVIGYLMMHNSSLKKFFLFAPAPDTGKSVLGDFIASLFPTDNTFRVQLSDFNRNFAMGSLGRRTLGLGMDLQPGIISDAAVTRLKLLTGEKLIDTEEKYMPMTTSWNHCKFIFASNHPLELSHPDDAFWDRLVLIPFVKPIDPECKNLDLPVLLQGEKSAIATRCAYAAQRLVRNNYQFAQPKSATRIVNSWRRYEYDPMVTFVQRMCTITNSPEDYISSQDLYKHYQDYCVQNGFTYVPQKTFSTRIKERFNLCGSKQRCGMELKSLNVIIGIKMKESQEVCRV